MQDRQDIAEFERRISAALDRIGKGVDRIARPPAPSVDVTPLEAEIRRLRAALEVEKAQVAQLTQALRAVPEVQTPAQMEAKVEKMTRQLDVQGLEMQRMRKTNIQLREQIRALTEAARAGVAEPHLINKAMMAELEALRAQRQTETAEMDEILAELRPLIAEAEADA
ncbi:MAG TPA: hypothetical protein VLA78_05500 [Paracoccaceae bacterium]|jgi:hypothetical protein|nr:hypothetical protein [Paracoccaceae bacterium]